MSATGTLFIVSAPSGAGKTTLVQALVKKVPNVCVSISYTTRAPRANEKEGEDYYFISQPQFKTLIEQGAFLEHAQVYGNFYGTSSAWVQKTLKQGKDVVLEIDWQGARQIRIQFSESLSIFIFPPSEAALIERLKKRHPENDELINKRMQESTRELARFDEYDYVICNDDFETALAGLESIVVATRLSLKAQKETLKPLIKELLGQK